MAENRKIEFAIIANIKDFKTSLREAGQQVKGFGADLKKSVSPKFTADLEKIGRGFRNIGIAAAAAAAGGLFAFARVMSQSIELANIQEQAEAKLGAVIKATGGAAGFTADELKTYATELQRLTGVGDEVTISGMAVLATFKELKGQVFKDATKAALDMSAVMGGDLQSSMLQLGKALNDPVKGLTALTRSGVSFTDQQKQQIKALAESGKLLEAQKIILKEINTQFGGAAEALRNTYGGAVNAAKGALNDLKEELGFIVTKSADAVWVANELEKVFVNWSEAIKANRAEIQLLVRNGIVNLVTGIQLAIEAMRIFQLGWKGVWLIGHATIAGLAVGLEGLVTIIRNMVKPLDILLSGLALAGIIEVNPLKDIEESLRGFRKFSTAEMVAEFDRLAGNVVESREQVDKAKASLEQFKQSLIERPVEFVGGAEEAKATVQETIKEVRKIGGVWTNIYADAKQKDSEFVAQAKQNLAALQAEAAKGNTTPADNTRIKELQAYLQQVEEKSSATAAKVTEDAAAMTAQIAEIGGIWTNQFDQAAAADAAFAEQAKKNLAALEAEAKKGGVSQGQLDRIQELKDKLASISPASREATKDVVKDTEKIGDTVEKIEGVWTNVFDEAEKGSAQVTRKMLSDIEKIKKAAASIKYGTGTSGSTQRFATGGAIRPFFGGLRGYGGGDRRLVLVEDGEHVIRKEAVRRLGHGFFQKFNRLQFPNLPKFATGGPIGPQLAMAGGGATYNLSVNFSGDVSPASRNNARSQAKMLLSELEKMQRRAS
jgi:hypothetical protein